MSEFKTCAGEKFRKQYVWGKDENGEEALIETEPIDIQQEIESYADECDIKHIVQKASFDPEFAQSLAAGMYTGEEVNITSFPTNIHEYHKMMATAQAKMLEIQQNAQKNAMPKTEEPVQNNGKEEKTE
nr:MAG TPA: Scaffold protein [Microviridae sp.]